MISLSVQSSLPNNSVVLAQVERWLLSSGQVSGHSWSVTDRMVTRLARLTTSKHSILGILVMIGLIELFSQYDTSSQSRESDVVTSTVAPPRQSAQSLVVRPQKILLLAYARSGSSFTGELLSSLPGAAYYYEPLFRNCSCLT